MFSPRFVRNATAAPYMGDINKSGAPKNKGVLLREMPPPNAPYVAYIRKMRI